MVDLFRHAGPVARVAICLWLIAIGYSVYCQWRLRAYRRPDVPAWNFMWHPRSAAPELYTAEGQPWLERAGAASAAIIIGFWVVGGLLMIGV